MEVENTSAVGSLARRALAWLVLIAAVLIVLRLAGAIVFGFITTVLTFGLIAVVIIAVVWAVRRL